MRTITLELLRHGPAHNQLLSPLTPYLALCQNHAAVTVNVPFEHNQFLHRLSALSYLHSEQSRYFQLNDTAQVMGEILGMIPGLTAESNRQEVDDTGLTHLRLILSASELALLPFEMALAPNGFPGAGQPLALQPQMPVCITREARRVPGEQLQWPGEPRILFVAAAPPEVGAIPLESHLLALRRAISPWIKHYHEGDEAQRRQRVEEHLVFLPDASVEAIEEMCATNAYTHVHILAHGVARRENFDTRFFLALHNSFDASQTDYISGPRLATALRASQRPDARGLSRPAVVTLASCNSGNVGSVAGAGSSIAHALHEAGIPMVVAGQFPLSFQGSVRLVECLYEGMLWGIDPRPLLYDLRRRLHTQFADTHDWAALTAYVSLPADFEQQLSDIQIERAGRSIDAAMDHADAALTQVYDPDRTGMLQASAAPAPAPADATAEEPAADETAAGEPADAEITVDAVTPLLDTARRKLNATKQRLERLLDYLPAKKSVIHGRLASTDKRYAQLLYTASTLKSGAEAKQRHLHESLVLLRSSREHYQEAFRLDRSNGWAMVQYISLSCVLERLRSSRPDEATSPARSPGGGRGARRRKEAEADATRPEAFADRDARRTINELWSLAYNLSLEDRRSDLPKLRIWAYGNLMELYLLSLILDRKAAWPTQKEAREGAVRYADLLIETAGRDAFEVYSTRRQVFRYVEWFNDIADMGAAHPLAVQLFERFPPDAERW